MLLTADITIGSQENTEMHTVPSNAVQINVCIYAVCV